VKLAMVAYHTARASRRLCDCFASDCFANYGMGGQAGLQLGQLGLTINGLTINGLTINGLTINGLTINGLNR
jgi:hypothetical protein